jgi:hypothetical protein
VAITQTYANIESAKRALRKRGITYHPAHAPHRATNPPGIHFDLDSAHVVTWLDKPSVDVTYYYFNARNEPR